MTDWLRLEVLDHVACVELRRPPVNALSSAMILELGRMVEDLGARPDVRAIVLYGAEQRFCAGFDVGELLASDPAAAVARNSPLIEVLQAVDDCSVPVIAAIERYALGGGCELAMACDVRVAASDASIGLPEINLGGLPGLGGMQRLSRLVGSGKAKQLVLTGSPITGAEAHRVGLVDEVSSPGEAVRTARGIAERMASRAPLSVRAGKRALNLGRDLPLAAAIEMDLRFVADVATTEDRAECLRAFADKREARVVGR
jgi:enoyl-CoA hydratase/carnithine racemase